MTYGQRVLILVVCWVIAFILFVTYFVNRAGDSEEAEVWGWLILPIILIGIWLSPPMGRRQFSSSETPTQEPTRPPRPVKPIPFWILLIVAFFAITVGNIVVKLLLPLLR